MSNLKHTPGPWGEVSDEFGWCQRGVGYPDGDDRDHHLCVVQAGDPDELEANARLIAAAPELLDALIGLVNLHCDWATGGRATKRLVDENNALCIAARNAIDKAIGA